MYGPKPLKYYNLSDGDIIDYNIDVKQIFIDCRGYMFNNNPLRSFIVPIKCNDILLNIKRIIFEKYQIPFNRQIFIYQSKSLYNEQLKIDDIFPISELSTFHLYISCPFGE